MENLFIGFIENPLGFICDVLLLVAIVAYSIHLFFSIIHLSRRLKLSKYYKLISAWDELDIYRKLIRIYYSLDESPIKIHNLDNRTYWGLENINVKLQTLKSAENIISSNFILYALYVLFPLSGPFGLYFFEEYSDLDALCYKLKNYVDTKNDTPMRFYSHYLLLFAYIEKYGVEPVGYDNVMECMSDSGNLGYSHVCNMYENLNQYYLVIINLQIRGDDDHQDICDLYFDAIYNISLALDALKEINKLKTDETIVKHKEGASIIYKKYGEMISSVLDDIRDDKPIPQ